MQNALPFAVNLQLGGGFRQLAPAEQGAAVRPRQTQAYSWHVPASVGPGKQDFSTVAYTYRSTVDPTAHENAGLIGAIVVGRQVSSPFPASPAEDVLRQWGTIACRIACAGMPCMRAAAALLCGWPGSLQESSCSLMTCLSMSCKQMPLAVLM